ncbi:MAG: hypothetical protein WAM27_05840 [Nitrososphaeraceae archaeon]
MLPLIAFYPNEKPPQAAVDARRKSIGNVITRLVDISCKNEGVISNIGQETSGDL